MTASPTHIFKHLFFSWLGLSVLGVPAWAQPQDYLESARARVFLLQSKTADQTISCSLTLVKVQTGSCVAITNYHCTPHGSRIEIPAFQEKAQVLKSSARYDIRLLKITPKLQEHCQNIAPVQTKDFRQRDDLFLLPVKAQGFVLNQATEKTVMDLHWTRTSYVPDISLESIGPNRRYDFLLKVRHLAIVPGMSGGVLIDTNHEVLGILSRYSKGESASLVLPWTTIEGFLAGKTPSPQESTNQQIESLSAIHFSKFLSKKEIPTGDNHHGNGGDNHHGNGGDNHHGNGGDNHHGNGGDGNEVSASRLAQDFSFFQEPDEGYPFEKHPKTLLLSANGEQIDGLNDYINHYVTPKQKKNIISREKNSLPSLQIRTRLLNRLDGYYNSQEGQHLVYRHNPAANIPWALVGTGDVLMSVDINSRSQTITVESSNHFLREAQNIFSTQAVSKNVRTYRVITSADASRITLASDFETFVCENKHYTKLICQGKNQWGLQVKMSFSLGNGQLKMMKTILLTPQVSLTWVADHYNSKLTPSSSPEKWRGQ